MVAGWRDDPIVAAHFRFGSMVGLGVKPDDFLCYPLGRRIHELYHTSGHPVFAWQLDRVAAVWENAFDLGIITTIDDDGGKPWRGLFRDARETCTPHELERVVSGVRAALLDGELQIGDSARPCFVEF